MKKVEKKGERCCCCWDGVGDGGVGECLCDGR